MGYLGYGDLFFNSRGNTREHDNKTPGSPPRALIRRQIHPIRDPERNWAPPDRASPPSACKRGEKKCPNCRATLIPTINLGRERGIARPKGEHRARCEHGIKPEGSSGATAPRLGLKSAKMDQNPRWPTATAHQKEAFFTVSTKNVREMKRAAKVWRWACGGMTNESN